MTSPSTPKAKLQACLEGELPAEQLDLILNDLSDEDLDALDMQEAFVWSMKPEEKLSQKESDALFAALFPDAEQQEPTKKSTFWPQLLSLAALLVALVGAGFWMNKALDPDPPKRTYRLKGAQSHTAFYPFLGQVTPQGAKVVRELEPGEQLKAQDHVVFRYKINQPSWLILWGQAGEEQPGEMLWQSSREMPPSEAEIEEGGQLLSLPVSRYAQDFELTLITIPSQDYTRLKELGMWSLPLLQSRCDTCTFVPFSLKVAP